MKWAIFALLLVSAMLAHTIARASTGEGDLLARKQKAQLPDEVVASRNSGSPSPTDVHARHEAVGP